MFDRFTQKARKVIALAKKESQRSGHDSIGSEHLLLGLIQEGTGVAAQVLKNLGVEINQVRREIEQDQELAAFKEKLDRDPYTPSARKALEHSLREADQLGHNSIGTAHLLLGILHEDQSLAARKIQGLGLKLEEIRNEALLLLDEGQEAETYSLPFTNRAMKVIDLACDEAKRLQMGAFDVGHLYLGLIAEEHGVAGKVLRRLGIALPAARIEIEKRLKDRPSDAAIGKFEWKRTGSGFLGIRTRTYAYWFTEDAERSMRVAREEAERLGQNFVGTEHILLAILRDEQGIPARVTVESGLKLDEVRREVLKLINSEEYSRLPRS